MERIKEIPNIQISRPPAYFILYAIDKNKKRDFGLSDQNFFKQILKRYQLTSAFFRFPLHFLLFQKRDGFSSIGLSLIASFFPSLSLLFKNYSCLELLVHTRDGGKNVITAVPEKDVSIHKFPVSNIHWFSPLLSFLPVLSLLNAERIESKILRENLHLHESFYHSQPVSTIAFILPKTDSFSRKTPESERVRPILTYSASRVMTSLVAKFGVDGLLSKDTGLHTDSRGNAGVDLLSTAREMVLSTPITNAPLARNFIFKREQRNNFSAFSDFRLLKGKIESRPKDTTRIDRKEIPGGAVSTKNHEALEKGVIKNGTLSPVKRFPDVNRNAWEKLIKKYLHLEIPHTDRKSLVSRNRTSYPHRVNFSPNILKNSTDIIIPGEGISTKSREAVKKRVIGNEIYSRLQHFSYHCQNAGEMILKKYLTSKISYIDRKSLVSRNRTDLPPVAYFSSNKPEESADVTKKTNENSRPKSLHADSSLAINPQRSSSSDSVPEINVFNLADRVYTLITERVKREREMRGY